MAVPVHTVYASVGRKPELAIAVVDMSLGSADDPLPVEERPYVRAIREASTARGKIEAYADGLSEVMPRTAPLLEALKRAGQTHPPSAAARAHIDERRAANMRHFAAELRATGELREDVTDDWGGRPGVVDELPRVPPSRGVPRSQPGGIRRPARRGVDPDTPEAPAPDCATQRTLMLAARRHGGTREGPRSGRGSAHEHGPCVVLAADGFQPAHVRTTTWAGPSLASRRLLSTRAD